MHYDPTQAILSVEQPGEVSATVVCVKFNKLVMVGVRWFIEVTQRSIPLFDRK